MSNKKNNIIYSVLFIILGLIFLVLSFNISSASLGSKVGPNIFPLGLSALLLGLSLFSVITNLLKKRAVKDEKVPVKADRKRFLRIFIVIAAMVIYFLLFERIGYIYSTVLFMMSMLFLMEEKFTLKNITKDILVAVIFTLCIYYLYAKVFLGNLPPTPEAIDFLRLGG